MRLAEGRFLGRRRMFPYRQGATVGPAATPEKGHPRRDRACLRAFLVKTQGRQAVDHRRSLPCQLGIVVSEEGA